VPGLPAKPIIDMIAGVTDLSQAEAAIEVLSGHSYVHAPHRPRVLWFHKPASPDLAARTHHLHLTEPGSDLWRERLAFRDALRADDALRDEYAELKQRLATAHGEDIGAYTSAKRDSATLAEPDHRQSVARVLAGEGIELRPR
jgi:GrpB-like predicted nucleotidyltransferase (UPF0157 family)